MICGAIALSLLALETFVRAAGRANADGQFTFLSYNLPPYALPLSDLNPQLERYLDNPSQTIFVPDAATGWLYPPKATFYHGPFTVNRASMRALREYSPKPAEDTLRIALFGDSCVAGSEVNSDDVWASRLEQWLIQAGVKTEVLNFGVAGYGMDQAFLRW